MSNKLSCRVIGFDLPGFGHSDAPAEATLAGYAQDVVDGLEALGIERFTLVGHSLGGAVATAVSELMPDKVAGLVLLAPVGFGPIPLADLASLPIARQLLGAALPWALSSRIAVTAAYLTMVTNGRLPEPEAVDRITKHARSLVDGTRKAIRAIADDSRRQRARRRRRVAYRGPVAAVWGDQDRLVPPSHRNGLVAALPQAQIQLWEGMGHHPVAERFDDLAALLADAADQPGRRVVSGRGLALTGKLRRADAA